MKKAVYRESGKHQRTRTLENENEYGKGKKREGKRERLVGGDYVTSEEVKKKQQKKRGRCRREKRKRKVAGCKIRGNIEGRDRRDMVKDLVYRRV